MKIGIIGAGPAGLCAIRQALSFDCEVIAFEQNDKIGGTWNYTDNIAPNKFGLDEHSSMYKGLRTNLPKDIMSYPDYPNTSPGKSYVSPQEILQYFDSYADHFDLREHIKFEHHVLRVRPLTSDKWEFVVRNLAADKIETFIFDAVLVCNGFSVPLIRKICGQEHFKGRQIHSHLYRDPKDFQNKSVLVVGGGPSGIDIVAGIAKVASKVLWSHHMEKSFGAKVVIKLPEASSEKPDVLKFTATGAEFVDGTFEEFSMVIYATGYDYKFPFLSIDCELSCHLKYVQPLYKHCININRPSMAIIGIPYFAVAMPLFDLQVRFCLTFMTHRKQLPTKEAMLEDTERDMNERWTRLPRHKAHFLGMEKHAQYYEDLAKTANIESLRPVVAKVFNKSFSNYFENFNECRKFNFKIIDDNNFVIDKE